MLEVTQSQLDLWLSTFMFPLARILGLMAFAPVFGNRSIPLHVKLLTGIVIMFALAPSIPSPVQWPAPGTPASLLVLAQESIIGVAMGMALRLAFAAVNLTGELVGLQMGLSFATFFDPQSSGQTAVIAEIFSLLTTLIFLAVNGHLLMLDVLGRSFELLPISSAPVAAAGWLALARAGAVIYIAGVMLALPLIATLLMTNIAMAVLTRAAPQLNLFAVGFPVTSTVGFFVLIASLNYFAPVIQNLFDRGFIILEQVLVGIR